MLKEKLYSEYQKRYKEYKEKHKKVENLQVEVKNIQAEVKKKKFDIEVQTNNELNKIFDKKKELERQLFSVKKDGANSWVVKNYNESKLRDIEETKSELRSLEQEKQVELKELRRRKQEAISELEDNKKRCQNRLNNLLNNGNESSFVKQFDEGELRQKLTKDKEREVTNILSKYDTLMSQTQSLLQNIDEEYDITLQKELAYIEDNSNLYKLFFDLNAKAVSNELPQVITEVMSESTTNVIQRNGINGGQKLVQIANCVTPLDDLSRYASDGLKKLVNVGLPLIVSIGILLFFIFSGMHLDFVIRTTNTVVTFLFWLVISAIAGGIGYGISKVKCKKGIIGGIIGGILGFWVVAHWSIILPDNVTSAVEWIIKVLICLLVGIGLYFANTHTDVGNFFVGIGMKFDFFKNEALLRQGHIIQENADSYCILIKYREILEQIVNEDKERRYVQLTSELEKLQSEKNLAVDSLVKTINQEIEQNIFKEKETAEIRIKEYEQHQKHLISMQEECMLELSKYDEKIQNLIDEIDEKISNSTYLYDKKISDVKKILNLKSRLDFDNDSLQEKLESAILDCVTDINKKTEQYNQNIFSIEQEYEQRIKTINESIDRLNVKLTNDLTKIHDIFHDINNKTVGFEESQGVLSDYLYIYNENSTEEPKRVIKIKHNKKPIVFLYDLNDTTNVSASLFNFMKAVLTGFYTINANDSFDVIIVDPVSKARKFEQMRRFLFIENDIKKISNAIQNSMRKVAKEGIHIDDYNRKMASDREDKIKYFKYKIVEFIVPEESAAQNTNFFDSDLWGTLGDGRENGFMPIFYISYSDWKNTFDDNSKLNSKFILQLKNAIGSSNGEVFKIDVENITVEKIN